MIFSIEVKGCLVGFKVVLLPFASIIFFFKPVILEVVTAFFCTVTEIVLLIPLFSVTVIFAFQAFFCAVIFPFWDTFTIFVLLDFHEATESPF